MGENYYVLYGKEKCKCCGNDKDRFLHIGKSSYRWKFALCLYPDLGINSLEDWVKFLVKNNLKICLTENEESSAYFYNTVLEKIFKRSAHPEGFKPTRKVPDQYTRFDDQSGLYEGNYVDNPGWYSKGGETYYYCHNPDFS